MFNAYPGGASVASAVPLVGGYFQAKQWYMGGGGCASGWATPWYIYNPNDLADVVNGVQQPDLLVPASMANYSLPHRAGAAHPYPIMGGDPDQVRPSLPRGAVYDEVDKLLYVLYGENYLDDLGT